jgi:hypothetical protein
VEVRCQSELVSWFRTRGAALSPRVWGFGEADRIVSHRSCLAPIDRDSRMALPAMKPRGGLMFGHWATANIALEADASEPLGLSCFGWRNIVVYWP